MSLHTIQQWLLRLIQHPDQLDDPNLQGQMYTGAGYVLDFRFDYESKSIIATCLAASQSINGTFFPKLLVTVLLLYYFERLSREDASDFVRALNENIQLEKIRETLTFAESISLMSASDLSPELTAGIIVKRNVFKMLSSARRFAIKTTGREQISARHLLGAILHGATASFQSYMQEIVLAYAGLNLAGTRSAFVELVGEYFPDDRLDAWEAMITEELAHKPGTESFTPLLTKIYADTVDRETDDLLDVDDDAIAISKIL